MIAADNTELATNYIQKTAVEKAIPEIDKRLTNVCISLFGFFNPVIFIPKLFLVHKYSLHIHFINIMLCVIAKISTF